MKQRNPFRKGVCMLLAAGVCMSLPLSVLAETTADAQQPEVTAVTETDETGTVVTVRIAEAETEREEWTQEVPPGEPVPPVEVELIPGQQTSGSVTAEPVTKLEGDPPEGPNDSQYDYTETTVTTHRQVEAQTGETEVTVTKEDTELTNPLQPEDYDGKHYDEGTIGKNNQPTGLLNSTQKDYNFPAGPKPEEAGYDYLIAGDGEGTFAACPVFMKVTYQKDADGNVMKDGDGNYIIASAELTYCNSSAVRVQSGMISPSQITLKKDGEYFYTYCIDSETEALPGKWYKVTNLEDCSYFPDEDSAAKLRAIVSNGYWGTDATVYETNADGSLRKDPETGKPIPKKDEGGGVLVDETTAGSLAKMKALMRQQYDGEDTVTVLDKEGNPVRYRVYDLIDGLQEHEALAVTQGAIWSCSNGSRAVDNGKDGEKVVGVFSSTKYFSSSGGWLDAYDRAYNTESDARMQALYSCLLSLDPIYSTEEGVTTVINEKNAVKDMSLTVFEKVEGHAANKDSNPDNDVYNTGLQFTLAFVPDPASDDLLVYLTDSEGKVLSDKDGNPMVRRLAGENSGGRSYDTILPDEQGVYTLTGLQLAENGEFVFDLRLEGTQYLKEGVYVYTAHDSREASQTLVGMAEGKRAVEVAVGMNITFEVDESQQVVAQRTWYSREEPEGTGENNGSSAPRPGREQQEDDEAVSPAAAPRTGDGTLLLAAISALSGAGYTALNFTTRRKEQ